jgi:hypothetical protein
MVKTLSQASVEELEAELERRKRGETPDPRDFSNTDFLPIYRMALAHVQEMVRTQDSDEDFEHGLYEMVMETVYGPEFWDWHNKQDWV